MLRYGCSVINSENLCVFSLMVLQWKWKKSEHKKSKEGGEGLAPWKGVKKECGAVAVLCSLIFGFQNSLAEEESR